MVSEIVNFQEHTSWMVHTIAEDSRTPLGPYIRAREQTNTPAADHYLGAGDTEMAQTE